MTKKSLRGIIEKMAIKPILASLLVFGVFFILIVGFSVFKYGYSEKFFENIVIEAHGMLFDILIIGVFIFALHRVGEKRLKKELEIERYNDEIDDLRWWESKEATFKIVGNIKRLNRYGITNIDLTICYLENATLKYTELKSATLLQAILKGADFEGANLQGAYLEGANLQGANFMVANLQGADLKQANLEGADFSCADLRNVKNLTIEQISKVKTISSAKLDLDLMEQIKKDYANLLEWPEFE